MNKLSIVVIAQNEQDMLEGCLASADWADELIVVDGHSTDRTVTIAKRHTQKVFRNQFTGFATQKNFGISQATCPWVLVLDADERISRQLKTELLATIAQRSTADIYSVPRINYFLGKRMDHGGWQHDRVERLFKRSKTAYTDQQIHECLRKTARTSVDHLSQPLYHFSHRDISSNLLKTKLYAEWDAHYHFVRHSPTVTKWTLFKGVIDHFWHRYIRERGYKDGTEGFIEAMYQAFSYAFIIQAMLWEKQRGQTSQQLYQQLDQQLKANNFSFETNS